MITFILSGLFYYVLGNLEPRLRSPTNSIQVVSIVKTSYIEKYGMDTILEPFVQAVAQLESVREYVYMYMHYTYALFV